MRKGKPVRPEEIVNAKRESLPAEVFDVVNELIAKKWTGREAKILQKDIVHLLAAKLGSQARIFEENLLDFEEVYRAVGWKVTYDKPAYNETYDAQFIFTKAPDRSGQ